MYVALASSGCLRREQEAHSMELRTGLGWFGSFVSSGDDDSIKFLEQETAILFQEFLV